MKANQSVVTLTIGVSIVACNAIVDNPIGVSQGASTSVSDQAVAATKPHFEAASKVVDVGSSCTIHPEGNTDPKETIPVQVDEDGVARFGAVRAKLPGAVERLALDCTGPDGLARTYAVDLRADETFAPRPWDPAHTNLQIRPALTGDPLGYTIGDLVQMGYGLRPDPNGNPGAYARWLTAASKPMRMHGSGKRAATSPDVGHGPTPQSTPATTVGGSAATPAAAGGPATKSHIKTLEGGTTTAEEYCGGSPPGCYWTGVILSGFFQPSENQWYGVNEGLFAVPQVAPGAFGTGQTEMSIWTGLDNVFQSIVWVWTTSTTVSTVFQTEAHLNLLNKDPGNRTNNYAPSLGDSIYAEEWYCDSNGYVDQAGGYACTYMADDTSGDVFSCTSPSGSCTSYPLASGNTLGFQSEFIVENDSPQYGGTYEWPDFESSNVSPAIEMTGSADVYQGAGYDPTLVAYATPTTDSNVVYGIDDPPSGNPYLEKVKVTVPSSNSSQYTTGWMLFPAVGVAASNQFGLSNQTDVFAVDNNGALTVAWINTGSWNQSEETGQNLFPLGASAAASLQFGTSNQTDVFAIDNSGALRVSWVVGGGGWSTAERTSQNLFPPGAPVAVSQQFGLNQTDVFAIDNNGALRVSWVYGSGNSWNTAEETAQNLFPPRAAVAASQQFGLNQTDVFAIDNNGALRVSWVYGSGSWNTAEESAQGLFPPGAPVAVSQQFGVTNQTDVFAVDVNGNLKVMSVQGGGSWSSPTTIGPAGSYDKFANIAASQQFGLSQTDVFAIDQNGALRVTWVYGNGTWNSAEESASAFPSGARIAASQQFGATQTDVFVLDNDYDLDVMWVGTGSWNGPLTINSGFNR